MTLLIAGLVLWTLAHGLKVFAPGLRARWAASLGETPVKGAVALAIIAAVALMALGYQRADFVALWTPPAWTVHLNNLLMLAALAIYASGAIPGHLRAWIRHPQLTATKIWATAHLIANGDLASVLLFGGLLAWAVATMIGVNKRDGKGPKPAPGSWIWDGVNIVVALALVAGIGWLHNHLGVWPFAGSPPA
ncbi:NnrU family protein [Paralimibaculum aggregatum]|uniref:NnrU family protein n=1 Tax=Paralimibaculum aggregatum TaxID=3036245 RepID=A0ABQ6LJ79_9RHOB|nr:NnrU family protein [Limibaculum sp. NKW23]GMG83314.1 NnrU family protein [Limibaculum sp. NKW23]